MSTIYNPEQMKLEEDLAVLQSHNEFLEAVLSEANDILKEIQEETSHGNQSPLSTEVVKRVNEYFGGSI